LGNACISNTALPQDTLALTTESRDRPPGDWNPAEATRRHQADCASAARNYPFN
jgi:hypothetical protein